MDKGIKAYITKLKKRKSISARVGLQEPAFSACQPLHSSAVHPSTSHYHVAQCIPHLLCMPACVIPHRRGCCLPYSLLYCTPPDRAWHKQVCSNTYCKQETGAQGKKPIFPRKNRLKGTSVDFPLMGIFLSKGQ
jgi:hypothetical protein